MKGYRKLRIGEIIKNGDIGIDPYDGKKWSTCISFGSKVGDTYWDEYYRPIKKSRKCYKRINLREVYREMYKKTFNAGYKKFRKFIGNNYRRRVK